MVLAVMDGNDPIEHTIYRIPVAAGTIPDITRTAVRAIISDRNRLLMIYSPVNGDYKFPGGGIEPGETHEQTLVREVSEEAGQCIVEPFLLVARIREYGEAMQTGASVFMMDSYYYTAAIDSGVRTEQSLDAYEDRLKFTPRWVTVDEAIGTNERLLAGSGGAPRWTPRETWLLRRLRDQS